MEDTVWFKPAIGGFFKADIDFSPDGKIVATTGGFGTILLYRVSDGSCLKTLKGHTGDVYSVVFSPDGRYLASGSGDETVKIWRVSDGRCLKTLRGHTSGIVSVAFSPDGKYIVSGSLEGLALWRVTH